MKTTIYPYKIFICKDEKTTAQACARALIKVVKNKPNGCLGLATGGTCIPVYESMVKDYQTNHTNYRDIKTFNLDEYINLNPLYIHESYRAYMNFRLFSLINIQMKNTHFPCCKQPSAYETLIQKNGGLDVQIISLGHNGHIAYNEPGSSLNSITRVITLTPSTIKANSRFFENNPKLVPKKAVSMGIKSILNARKVIVIITGIGKAQAFGHILKNKYDPQWPCSAVIFHKDVEIYVDAKTAQAAGYKKMGTVNILK
ncbi:MAG: glucosamine-6-phosphate deaminase [Mycoplasmataceae bacterium]|jgi:glucosamine-6-phosphate deaminase|nr:glucosamine-6-phosphate deaminase [Mycoplasmataceae bacterium]